MLGNGARQVSGSAAWLAQTPSGAIVGINGYRLMGDTAELADLYAHRGYTHGRWTRGKVRVGALTKDVGGDAGDYHYAVIDQADLTLRQQTVRGCRGVFTTPTVVGGSGPVGCVSGTLDMVWQDGTLRLLGSLEVQADGQRATLLIRHYQPDIGTTCHGGSPFGSGTYDLTPVVAENGMLRCVILYRQRFDSGVTYQGVAMFEAHTHFRTQNMYTKDGVNC
ncbi:hypothetical protein [Ralstonia flaminis]|jgi:hypothetical protein|uniref:Uncharacterized protein n=1 Tax=Ralstonia flaminis TaxID=3058597 RepID=A0ABM9K7U7_9RALS|nr:hypothetical protein [Ralstonia sp. LMG 18101]CAJ0815752.1 hypothetical protein LMG18101_02691 [Ralstonia sp. LMG 18101]